jgi:hypothetical protein
MNPILKKLHIANRGPVLILNAPDEFQELLSEIEVEIHEEIEDYYHYVQIFVQEAEEAEEYIKDAISVMEPGAYFWFCYPKETSDEFDTDIDKEVLNELIESFDMEGITQISLSENWTAIRLKFTADEDEDEDGFVAGDKGKRRFHGGDD